VFTVQLAGFGPGVYLANPDDIKTVFTGDPRTFHAGEAYSMLAGMLGPSSVVLLDGDLHRDRRRLMMAPFRLEAVARQHQLIGEIAAAHVAGWPVGVEFPVAPKMAEITLEVILRTVIGASDPQRLAALRAVMPRLLTPGTYDTPAIARPGGDCAAGSPRPTSCCTPRSPTGAPTLTSPSAPTRWPCWYARARTAVR
jgi:cytochrome P450